MFISILKQVSMAHVLTVDQVHKTVSEDGDGRQAPGLRVSV